MCSNPECEDPIKLTSEFYSVKGSRDGLSSQCKECHRRGQRLRRQREKAQFPKEYAAWERDKQRYHKYDLTADGTKALFESHRNCCFVCGETDVTKLVPDHDHSGRHVGADGKDPLRGALCGKCNAGIGLTGDSLEAAKRVVAYLERYEANPKLFSDLTFGGRHATKDGTDVLVSLPGLPGTTAAPSVRVMKMISPGKNYYINRAALRD